MKVLALGFDVVAQDDPRFAALRPAEARRVWELYQADILREVYFRADSPNGVLLFEVADVAAARAAIDGLPLVSAGSSTSTWCRCGPTRGSRGSSRSPERTSSSASDEVVHPTPSFAQASTR